VTKQVDYLVIGLGAFGSATAYELARRGHEVLGLERFEFGHVRGASHDTSRILRHSYHTPGYVRLSFDAYDDWARLEEACGEQLVTQVGGLDLFPPNAAIGSSDYTAAMSACNVAYEVLDEAEIRRRWPQFRVPVGTLGLFQERASIVPAGTSTSILQAMALHHGAQLRDMSPVLSVCDLDGDGVEVATVNDAYRARRVVICVDAWTTDLLSSLYASLPLTVTLEQVTYFAPREPERFAPGRLPLWIWMDDPSYYGFPCYGEPTVKAAQDCGGPEVSGDDRTFDARPDRIARLAAFMDTVLPGSGAPVRSKTCLYTLTPDRDFVLDSVPGHEAVLVGLGAAHGMKFAPTFGRLLADLATTGTTDADISPFAIDRPALTRSPHSVNWLV
jgi:sarcosine oxidase